MKKEGSRRALFFRSDALLDLRLLAHAVAQVVQLGAADLAAAQSLHGNDRGGMHGEYLLAANAVANAADGDRLVDAAVLLGDDGAVEGLVADAVALLDADGDAHGVADVHFGQFALHVLLGQSLDQIHSDPSFDYGRS